MKREHTPITIDELHPDLRGFVESFLLKCKYPYTIASLSVRAQVGADLGLYYTGVAFIDPNNPEGEMAGGLRYAWVGRYGKRRLVFRIISRENQTDKYANDRERRRSKETKDAKKVLNFMRKLIVPFTPQDIAAESITYADKGVTNWRDEFYRDGYRLFTDVSASTLAEEVAHLVSLGVEFKTSVFKTLATIGLHKRNEFQRRSKATPECYFVNIKEGRGIDVVKRTDHEFLAHYDKFEDMPALLQEGVSLLKMLSDETHMGTIGCKITNNTFWVYEGMD